MNDRNFEIRMQEKLTGQQRITMQYQIRQLRLVSSRIIALEVTVIQSKKKLTANRQVKIKVFIFDIITS